MFPFIAQLHDKKFCYLLLLFATVVPVLTFAEVQVKSPVKPGKSSLYESPNCTGVYKIVVLGSSTSYGFGASPIDSSWVNKYARYITSKNALNQVVNLATPSVTTYQILCPTGFIPPSSRPLPDTTRNISKALSLNPDAIIINLPTNDVGFDYTLQEQQANYERAMALADARHIPVWVTTSQPRSNFNAGELNQLSLLRDWINLRFTFRAIDFWTTVANADGTINPLYNSGDNVHVNNAGHQLFYERVVEKDILGVLCTGSNQIPVARAGNNQVITLPLNNIQLNGGASFDPDGSIVAYSWKKLSGPDQFSFSNPGVANPQVGSLVQGIYAFELTVTDNSGATSKDTVIITVELLQNRAPVAYAETDQTITLPVNSISLSANGSYDPDGQITGGGWKKIAGPASYDFSDSLVAFPVVSNLVKGVYAFELTVIDNGGARTKDTVFITVQSLQNISPVAYAGVDQTITLPVNSVSLSAYGSYDPDGQITGGGWKKISGPAFYNFSDSLIAFPVISNLVRGIYAFELTVIDNGGARTKDTVLVTVNQGASNKTAFIEKDTNTPEKIFYMYPNPGRGNFNIRLSNEYTGPLAIAIINQSGMQVKSFRFDKNSKNFKKALQIPELAPGIYFIRVNLPGYEAVGNFFNF